MKSNLQANSLVKSGTNYFLSELIEFDKKDFKKLKAGSWLQIKSNSLDIEIIKSSVSFWGRLYSKNSYFLIEKSDSLPKSKKAKKEHFKLKAYLEKELINTQTAIAKEPISAKLIRGKKEFALINLYIDDCIFIEVKELL